MEFKINENDSLLRYLHFSPIMEEGILIVVAIAVILGIIGLIFSVMSLLDGSSSLFNQF